MHSRGSPACLFFPAPLAPPLLTFQSCNNSDPCHHASAPLQRATPLCKMPHTPRNNGSDGLLNIWSLTSSRRASADAPVTAAGTCKAQQNLSIIPPKQPLRCTSEPYRLTNGQREEGPSVCGKLSRGQQAAVRANQQQGISAVLVHGCINLRKRCCQHEIFIVETILQKKLS